MATKKKKKIITKYIDKGNKSLYNINVLFLRWKNIMKRLGLILIENSSYKSKYSIVKTYSILSKQKQGIVVSKRR